MSTRHKRKRKVVTAAPPVDAMGGTQYDAHTGEPIPVVRLISERAAYRLVDHDLPRLLDELDELENPELDEPDRNARRGRVREQASVVQALASAIIALGFER